MLHPLAISENLFDWHLYVIVFPIYDIINSTWLSKVKGDALRIFTMIFYFSVKIVNDYSDYSYSSGKSTLFFPL